MITDKNYREYIDKEDLITTRTYGRAIFLPRGEAIFLPKGESIMDTISNVGNFIKDNKEAINTAANAIATAAKTGIDIAKGVEEVENLKALRTQAKSKKDSKAMAANIFNTTGEGFKILNS